MNFNWLQERWYEFRLGGIYWGTVQSLISFTIITYTLYLERFNIMIFKSIFQYALIFCAIYIPLRIIVGYIHRIKQMKHDTGLAAKQNPVIMDIIDRLDRIEKKLDRS